MECRIFEVIFHKIGSRHFSCLPTGIDPNNYDDDVDNNNDNDDGNDEEMKNFNRPDDKTNTSYLS